MKKIEYINVESAIRPKEIEIGAKTVYLRRNVIEVQRNNGIDAEETGIIFVYEEAKLSKDDALLIAMSQLNLDEH